MDNAFLPGNLGVAVVGLELVPDALHKREGARREELLDDRVCRDDVVPQALVADNERQLPVIFEPRRQSFGYCEHVIKELHHCCATRLILRVTIPV